MIAMKCEEVKNLWQGWLEDELPVKKSQKLSDHLDHCEDCRRWQVSILAMEESLELLGEEVIEPPPLLLSRVMANISDAGTFSKKDASSSKKMKLFTLFAPQKLAMAAAILLAFGAGLLVEAAPDATSTGTEGVQIAQNAPLSSKHIVLEYEASAGARVGLVGDFNKWGLGEKPAAKKNEDGKWVFELDLAPGRYQYAFVVNGKKWLPDLDAKGIIPDGFGGMNSLLYVAETKEQPL
jgi:hypothetical protein